MMVLDGLRPEFCWLGASATCNIYMAFLLFVGFAPDQLYDVARMQYLYTIDRSYRYSACDTAVLYYMHSSTSSTCCRSTPCGFVEIAFAQSHIVGLLLVTGRRIIPCFTPLLCCKARSTVHQIILIVTFALPGCKVPPFKPRSAGGTSRIPFFFCDRQLLRTVQ